MNPKNLRPTLMQYYLDFETTGWLDHWVDPVLGMSYIYIIWFLKINTNFI